MSETPDTKALAVRQEAPVAVSDVDGWIPVVNDYALLATKIADTEFVPRQLRGKPAAVAAALLYGREIGLPPMTALTGTHVVEGRPAASAETMRALVLAAGHEIIVEESTGAACKLSGRRRGSERYSSVIWTIDMARAAGLAGKDNWKHYPRQMLQARATAELCRLVFPDVIHGMRALEELDETDTPAPEALVSRAEPIKATRRRKPVKVTTPAPAPTPAPEPDADAMPLPGEDGYGGDRATDEGLQESAPADLPADEDVPDPTPPVPLAEAVAEVLPIPEEEPVEAELVDEEPAPSRPISRPQSRMLLARFSEIGIDDRDQRLNLLGRMISREVTTTNDLSKDEASYCIDTLAHVDTAAKLTEILDGLDRAARGEK